MISNVKRVGFAVSAGVLFLATGCQTTVAPASPEYRAQKSIQDMDFYNQQGARPEKPLTVEDAVHFALAHNMELWVAREQIAIQQEMKERTILKMLPTLMLNGTNSRRSREDVSSSTNYYTGATSVPTSYSTDLHQKTFDAEMSWNLLDFGLTYVSSKQETNRKKVTEQIYRRTRQKMILDVKAAYWTAVTMSEMAKVANSIGVIIEKQLKVLRRQIKQGNISKEDSLKQELRLLGRMKAMNQYERDAQIARVELARITGMSIAADYQLAKFDFYSAKVGKESLPSVDLVGQYAIMNRPELHTKDLEEAISYDDAKAALLKMLPSPSMFWRFDYDKDSHLLFDNWTTFGLRASWNLFAIPYRWREHKIGNLQAAIKERERMALTVGVMTQVGIAFMQYQEALRGYEMADDIHDKRLALLDAVVSGAKKGTRSEAEVVDQKLLYLQDRAAFLLAFAKVATAKARIYSTMGIDPDQDGHYQLETLKTPAEVLDK
jgi:outer membrane protein TolC